MKKGVGLLLVVVSVFSLMAPVSARAGEGSVQEIFADGFYGGLLGVLVGGAAMILTDKPSDHKDYLSTGAGVGIILGTTYGAVKASHAFADISHDGILFGLPSLTLEARKTAGGTAEGRSLLLKADLLRISFE